MPAIVPVGVAVSPNGTFICTSSPSPITVIRTAVHSSPRRITPGPGAPVHPSQKSDFARAIIAAIYSRKSPSDVIHALTTPAISPETVVSVLLETLHTIETNPYGLAIGWIEDFMGVVTEVYL